MFFCGKYRILRFWKKFLKHDHCKDYYFTRGKYLIKLNIRKDANEKDLDYLGIFWYCVTSKGCVFHCWMRKQRREMANISQQFIHCLKYETTMLKISQRLSLLEATFTGEEKWPVHCWSTHFFQLKSINCWNVLTFISGAKSHEVSHALPHFYQIQYTDKTA